MSVADQLGPRPFTTMRPRFANATELVLYVMSNCGHRPAGQPTAIHSSTSSCRWFTRGFTPAGYDWWSGLVFASPKRQRLGCGRRVTGRLSGVRPNGGAGARHGADLRRIAATRSSADGWKATSQPTLGAHVVLDIDQVEGLARPQLLPAFSDGADLLGLAEDGDHLHEAVEVVSGQ